MKKKILTLVGGISKESINKKLFISIKKNAPENFEFTEFDISSLPFYSQDLESDPPEKVKELKERIKNSDGVLIVTPEYNRSIPGVLKNAIDWASRPYGASVWSKKRAAIIGMTPGNTGTMSAQQHLRFILNCVDVLVLPSEIYLKHKETLNDNGDFASERTREHILKFLNKFSNFISET
jgi:NAD(P)H-dependent FMN reductase